MSNSSEQALNVIEAHIPDLSQSDGFMVFRLLCEKFSWSGTVFTPDDVATQIQNRRERDDLDPLTDDQLKEMTNAALISKGWNKRLPDWMTSEGWEVIDDILDDMEHSNAS